MQPSSYQIKILKESTRDQSRNSVQKLFSNKLQPQFKELK